MPWHLSKSDPRKVYDEGHETVCVCQNAEQAAKIVGAVNALPRETAATFLPGTNKSEPSGRVTSHRTPSPPKGILNRPSLESIKDQQSSGGDTGFAVVSNRKG